MRSIGISWSRWWMSSRRPSAIATCARSSSTAKGRSSPPGSTSRCLPGDVRGEEATPVPHAMSATCRRRSRGWRRSRSRSSPRSIATSPASGSSSRSPSTSASRPRTASSACPRCARARPRRGRNDAAGAHGRLRAGEGADHDRPHDPGGRGARRSDSCTRSRRSVSTSPRPPARGGDRGQRAARGRARQAARRPRRQRRRAHVPGDGAARAERPPPDRRRARRRARARRAAPAALHAVAEGTCTALERPRHLARGPARRAPDRAPPSRPLPSRAAIANVLVGQVDDAASRSSTGCATALDADPLLPHRARQGRPDRGAASASRRPRRVDDRRRRAAEPLLDRLVGRSFFVAPRAARLEGARPLAHGRARPRRSRLAGAREARRYPARRLPRPGRRAGGRDARRRRRASRSSPASSARRYPFVRIR